MSTDLSGRAWVASSTTTSVADWVVCPSCHELVYARRYRRDLMVCQGCGHHGRVHAPDRLAQLLDAGSARPIRAVATLTDPLTFVDRVPYRERLADTRHRTGLDEAVVCAAGEIEGGPVVLAVMDFRFFGGSLGCAVGESLYAAAVAAVRAAAPLVLVTASGGARMQEGALALMQMVKTTLALSELDRAGLPTVTIVSDPTYGGVAASFATQADVILAEPAAHLGFAGPRVIEQTIRERLPAGMQTSEFLHQRGLVDAVVPRRELRSTLANLFASIRPSRAGVPSARPDPPQTTTGPDPGPTPGRDVGPTARRDPEQTVGSDPWQTVCSARRFDRPTTLDYANLMLDGFHELHGDRLAADCPAIVGGVGRLAGRPVMLIGHQKAHTTRELVARRFGMPSPAGYRKAARLMRLAAKWSIPVVSLIDTPGAHPGVEAEREGQAFAIADSLRLMATLGVPVVAVVTGEGGSGGALALAVADRVLVLANAVYSVISPEGCAAILWRDAAAAPQAARRLRLDSAGLIRHGIVDAVVAEPEGGAHTDHQTAATLLRAAVAGALTDLDAIDPATLVSRRAARFLAFGLEPSTTSDHVDVVVEKGQSG